MANTPNIRFRGFTDDWEQRKFSDFTWNAGKRNKEGLDLEPYAITNEHGFIKQSEAHDDFGYMKDTDRKAYNIVMPNSFAYNPARINVGSIGYYEGHENVIVSSLYEVFRTANYVDDRFLWHWFKSDGFTKWIERLQEGSVRLYFYYDKLCECQMLLPSVPEQKKIAEVLDNLDNLINLHQRKCDETKELKKFMLQKMFPKNGEKKPEIRFEGFTDDWEQRKLGDNSELITKGTTPSSFCEDGHVTFVKIEAIRGKRVVKEFCTAITEGIHRGELARSMLKENDIVFAIAGATVGKCAVITRDILPANTNQALAIIRLKSNVDRDFIYFSLTSKQMEMYINQSKSVGAQPNLSLTQMNNFEFLCPCQKEEQQRIGECFANLDNLITLHQRKCDEIKEIKKFMLQNMFPQKG